MTNFAHAKYGPDTVRIDDPTYVVPLLTEDLTVGTGLAFPAADTVAIEAGGVEKVRFTSTLNSLAGATTLLANSASAALTVTQTGAGNAFVVEDSASTDSTPFVITGAGRHVIGHTAEVAIGAIANQAWQAHGNATIGLPNTSTVTWYSGGATSGLASYARSKSDTVGTHAIVASGDEIHTLRFAASDGVGFISAASINASVDGTPGVNDMPGRLIFSTTADGSGSLTEAMRIDSSQSIYNNSTGTGTNSYGFNVSSALTGATNNYGFYGNIAAAANRYNFYAAGTADNYFAGSVGIGTVPTATTKTYITQTQASTSAAEFGVYSLATQTNTSGTVGKYSGYFQSTVSTGYAGTGSVIGLVGTAGISAAHAGAAFNLIGLNGLISTSATGTVTSAVGVQAGLSNVGAATITNGISFYAPDHTVGVSGFGFYSGIAAAANRYNFYAAGTAQNYFAGVTGIGIAPAATSQLTLKGGTTAISSLNIPHGAAPTSPVNGDMWTTAAGLYVRINGATIGPLS
jgi:hypothetical protein